ncbi:aspartate/glutamate racemase family protein [Rubrivirga sp.]|uniref:aspartate/glutamate racemase family protein n=1 Tax=Rubrivirga sp. TaxID=1885344 RepID=UPI003B520795
MSEVRPGGSPSLPDPALSALHGAPSPDERNAVGVLGGLGPYAGLDLVRSIFDETDARTDQGHLPVTLVSYPNRVPDRATWLADPTAPSPLPAMMEVLRRLDDAGCAVAGVPCNTAHAPALFDRLRDGLLADGRDLALLHIVDAIVARLAEVAPDAGTIGVLATTSSIENRLHQIGLEAAGLSALVPDAAHQAAVQNAIYGPTGLKAESAPPRPQARQALLDATDHLIERGAQAVILGCTELPLAVPEADRGGVPFVNSTRALARALIRATHPGKLRQP